MDIDTQTLYVLSTLSLFGVAALVALSAYSYPATLKNSGYLWAVATFIQGLAMAAIALRGVVPDAVSVIAAHGFGIGGIAGFHHALERFAGGRVRAWLIYGPVALALASSVVLLLVIPSYAARVAVFSSIGALQFALCAEVAWRARGSEVPLTARVTAIAFAVGAVLFLLRAVLSIGVDASSTPAAIFRASGSEQAIVLTIMLEFLFLSFTFVMLCNERINTQLRRMAVLDPLTGRQNRRGMLELGQRELSRARRNGLALGVALVDLDHLKAINDAGGHALGDAALRHIVRCLEQELRTEDCFGRWGGDEFLVVLPDTDSEGAAKACERVRRLVAAAPARYQGAERWCTVSIGVASRRGDALDFEPLVNAADEALYVAKQKGRDRVAKAPLV